MVDDEPSLVDLVGDRSCPHLEALPPAAGAEDVTVSAPVDQVRAGAVVDLSKGGVTVVAGAMKHGVLALDLSGEENTVSVVGWETVADHLVGLEILRGEESTNTQE